MALRSVLGADVRLVHEQVDELLNSEDALLVLIDGDRVVSYAHGFATSPCQLELVVDDIERTVRRVVGRRSPAKGGMRRDREQGIKSDGRRGRPRDRQRCPRPDAGQSGRVEDKRNRARDGNTSQTFEFDGSVDPGYWRHPRIARLGIRTR